MPTLNLRLEEEYKIKAWPKDKVTFMYNSDITLFYAG